MTKLTEAERAVMAEALRIFRNRGLTMLALAEDIDQGVVVKLGESQGSRFGYGGTLVDAMDEALSRD